MTTEPVEPEDPEADDAFLAHKEKQLEEVENARGDEEPNA